MTNSQTPRGHARSGLSRVGHTSRGAGLARRLLVGVLLLTATSALAQRKKITLDDLVIEGNIQKPEAFFILPRSNLNLTDLERREDLKARIVDAAHEPPF